MNVGNRVLPSDFRNQVLAKLKQRGVCAECELCGKNSWMLVENVSVPVSSPSNFPTLHIPSAGLICTNCGNMRLLSLGALDLSLDEKKEQQEKVT